MCETEVEDEHGKLVLLLEKVPSYGSVNTEDITECMTSDKRDEITGNNFKGNGDTVRSYRRG